MALNDEAGTFSPRAGAWVLPQKFIDDCTTPPFRVFADDATAGIDTSNLYSKGEVVGADNGLDDKVFVTRRQWCVQISPAKRDRVQLHACSHARGHFELCPFFFRDGVP